MEQMNSSIAPGLIIETSAAKVSCAAACARFSLRARNGLEALDDAFGVALPRSIGERSKSETVEVLCVGPDEWILLSESANPLLNASDAIYASCPHSLVDISGREVTFEIGGIRATDLLTIGMARDPKSIPIGGGKRTVFDGVTVTIWHDDLNRYRMTIWNSFAPHIRELLVTGCRELAAEAH